MRTKQTPNQQMERNNKDQGWDQWDQNQKTVQRINETKSLFFEKIYKFDKPLTSWENRKINKIN
jgi:hypothetical protein